MTINDEYYFQRQINCDAPREKIILVHKYKSVLNGVEKDDTFSDQVYSGKDIENKEFMQTLLEHALDNIIK